MKTRILNWKRPTEISPAAKTYKLSRPDGASVDLPSSVDLRPGCSPVFDQGDLGSCTSMAWCGLLEYLEIREDHAGENLPEYFSGGSFDPLSEMFFYYNERVVDGDIEDDSGSSLYIGSQVAENVGICGSLVWPYDEAKFKVKPCAAAFSEALKHKERDCFGLSVIGLTELKSCLVAGFPFVMGIDVYESFMSDAVASSGMCPMPADEENLDGGHALCVVGFDNSVAVFPGSAGSWLVRNSWGADWGLNGYFWLPFEYEISDCWTARPRGLV